MKLNMLKWFLAAAVLSALAATLLAAEPPPLPGSVSGDLAIFASPDHADGLYQSGEKVTFTVRVTKGSAPVLTGEIDYDVVGNGGIDVKKGSAPLGPDGAKVVIEHQGPIALILAAKYAVDGGKPIAFKVGAAIDPTACKVAVPAPPDFDAFWTEQKRKLAALPMNAKLTPVPNLPIGWGPEVESFDVQADCLGGAPLSGYFVRPKGAKPKSLPARISFHGAGAHSSNLQSASNWGKRNMLGMDINAHGSPNGQPDEYYANLLKTTLKNYPKLGLENREKAYLLGLYLRVARALEFITSQPEWDGKNLIVSGSSQGGAQSIIAAGLDSRVTLISAGAPALCNLAAGNIGQGAGWPFASASKLKPEEQITVQYFDVCHFAARAKAGGVIRFGLADTTCFPTGMLAAYNALPGKKHVVTSPYASHSWTAPESACPYYDKARDLFDAMLAEALKK